MRGAQPGLCARTALPSTLEESFMSQFQWTKPVAGSSGIAGEWKGADAAILDAAAVSAIQPDTTVPPGTDLFVSGVVDNTGVIYLITDGSDGGENGAQIQLTGSTDLEGGGRIVMGGTTSWGNYIDGQNNGYVLSNVNDTIMGAGNIGQGGLGTGILTLVNYAHGVIDACYANQLNLTTNGKTVLNYGLLEGAGSGGLLLNSWVRNLGGGEIFAGTGSQVDLNNNTVAGGVLTTGGTGSIDAEGVATLVNVDSKGALVADDGDAFVLSGTLTNSGVITLAADGHGANLQMAGVVTLTGGGQVNMVDTGGAPNANAIGGDSYAPGGSLINVNNTISGTGTIGNEGVGGASLVSLTNEAAGVIDASDASTVLTINGISGLITNEGMIDGTGAAGLVISGGSIKNTGGTIYAANGSQVVLNGNASVTGGTLNSAGTGAFYANGAYLTNVANKANIDLTDGGALYLSTTLVNSGDIALSGGGHGANIFVSSPTLYLSGGGTISLNGPTSWANSISGTASGDRLVNVNNTITGGGAIGGDNLVFVNDVGGVVDGSDTSTTPASLTFQNGAGVINQGKIEGTSASGVTFTSTTVNNAGGTILAATGSQIILNGATLDVGTLTSAGTGVVNVDSATLSYVTNKANVALGDGSALYLSGALINTGDVTVQGGGHGGNIFISNKNGKPERQRHSHLERRDPVGQRHQRDGPWRHTDQCRQHHHRRWHDRRQQPDPGQ
jgi:hypothetical protein